MRQENRAIFAAICCAAVVGAGCCGFKEGSRGFLGVSTKVLEDGRQNAISRTYPVNYAKCLETVNTALADSKAYVYARKDADKMIAFYLTESDTTPVGVFFTEKDGSATEVAVSSPSRYAKEFITDKIAAGFNKKPARAGKIPAAAVAATASAGTPPEENKK
ncbi:MAG: hypothetical protein WCY10_05485 [Candidatus Omnitrophota bacterium]